MSELVEFLRARLNEQASLAGRARDEAPDAVWEAEKGYDGIYEIDLRSTHPESDSYGEGQLTLPREMALHIAAHDPAFVLADIAAKRQIIDWCSQRDKIYVGLVSGGVPQAEDFVDGDFTRREDAYVLRLLAQPYTDHSDFQDEWRVTRSPES